MIAAAILKAIEKLREEGQTSGRGGEKKKENPLTSPLDSFFDSPLLSARFNVQDGWRSLTSSFAWQNKLALQTSTANTLFIFVIFNYNFRSSWRCRVRHKGKF